MKKKNTAQTLLEQQIQELLAPWPDPMSRTDFRKACHIGTRTSIYLLESGLDHLCDQTIAVTAPLELRVRRIMARDGITEQYARLRISAQKADEYYRSKCDCELTNSADTAEAFQADARLFFHRMVEAIREEKRHGAV